MKTCLRDKIAGKLVILELGMIALKTNFIYLIVICLL